MSRVRALLGLIRLHVINVVKVRPASRVYNGVLYVMVRVRRLAKYVNGYVVRLHNDVRYVKYLTRRVSYTKNLIVTQGRYVTLYSLVPSNEYVNGSLTTTFRHLFLSNNRSNVLSLLRLVTRRVSPTLLFNFINSRNVRLPLSTRGLPMRSVVILGLHTILHVVVRGTRVSYQIRGTREIILAISVSGSSTRLPRGHDHYERSISTTNTFTLNYSLTTRRRYVQTLMTHLLGTIRRHAKRLLGNYASRHLKNPYTRGVL